MSIETADLLGFAALRIARRYLDEDRKDFGELTAAMAHPIKARRSPSQTDGAKQYRQRKARKDLREIRKTLDSLPADTLD